MQKHIMSLYLKRGMQYPVGTVIAVVGAATTTVDGSRIGLSIFGQLRERGHRGSLTVAGQLA